MDVGQAGRLSMRDVPGGDEALEDSAPVPARALRLFVLGASGGVGASLLAQAAAHGHGVTAQTRSAARLATAAGVRVVVGAPADEAFLA